MGNFKKVYSSIVSETNEIFRSFLSLFLPFYCAGCGYRISENENTICTQCLLALSRTDLNNLTTNTTSEVFWGRIQVEYAVSFCHFSKEGVIQHLLHALKYKRQPKVGFILGQQLGAELRCTPMLVEIDCIVPVPLHPKRFKKRGYNQAEWFAKGIASNTDLPIEVDAVFRKEHNKTQTKLSRYERLENVQNLFSVKDEAILQNKHLLLVDDVLTTGATLESFASTLLELEGVKISIATIAIA